MFRALGVVLIVIAVAAATVPMFTDCQSHGLVITMASGKTTPMKCHWTGLAELGMALPLAAVGAMMIPSRRKETRTCLAGMGIVIAGVMLALPTGLIGVCDAPRHTCVTLMKPSLILLGSVAALGSIVGLVWSRRAEELA
jgi:hypothetical protein